MRLWRDARFYLLLPGVVFLPLVLTGLFLYGVESLGSIKSTVATLGIFSTALGPLLLGWLLQAGLSFSTILPGCVAFALAATALNLLVALRMRQTGARFIFCGNRGEPC